MRLTALLLIIGLSTVAARTSAQVTLTEKGGSLEKVLKSIQRQQKDYSLTFDKLLLQAKAKPVTVEVKNLPVEAALEKVFAGQDQLTYVIVDKIISVKEKKPVSSVVTPGINVPAPPPTVHGRITNEKGEPVVGVSIAIKGGRIVGVTDGNGEFTLNNVADNAVLVFSAVTVETLEVKLGGRKELAFSLRTKVSELDEIQIIAYGQTSKRLQTGNVATVKGEDIAKQPVQNPLLALEGRVPGLVITQATGVPGSGVTVRIQGQNSINSGNDPLYIIDGVPFVSQMLPTTKGPVGGVTLGTSGSSSRQQGGIGNPLSYIDPSEIENISVLKDADATAIYGSRAANGAILITTKKGKAGPAKIDINIQQGAGKVMRMLPLMNTQQYLQMRREAFNNDGLTPGAADYDLQNQFGWDTTRFTDWQKVLIGGTARFTNIEAGISGGTSNLQYLVSGTFNRQTSVFPGQFSDKRAGLHFSLNGSSLNQKFKFQLSGSYLADNNQLPNSDLTNFAVTLPPNAPTLYNPDGTLNWALDATGNSTWRFGQNPIATNTMAFYENKTTNLISNGLLSYELIPGLVFKTNLGYTNLETDEYAPTPLSSLQPLYVTLGVKSAASYTYSSMKNWIIEPQLNYYHTYRKNRIDLLVGATAQQNNSNGFTADGTGYNSDALLPDIHSAATVTIGSSIRSVYKASAIFARINSIWNEKYILNLTARRDGSSHFGSENQFHNFGAIGAAWIFTEEKVFKEKLSFFSYGKLRGSYGATGNDQIGDYQYLNLYTTRSVSVPYQGIQGMITNALSNPYLQWEETRKLQLGIDLGFFKENRLLVAVTYVRNRSSNQLVAYSLPSITGFGSITANFPATVQNQAWELSLNSMNVKNKIFSWSSSLNITIPRNKLVAFPDLATSTYKNQLVIDQPISITQVYQSLGVDPVSGLYVFKDANGQPTLTNPSLGLVKIKSAPDFYGGFQNSFSYKNFQLDFLFQFTKQIGNGSFFGAGNGVSPGARFINQPVWVLSRWQKPGDNATVARFTTTSTLNNGYGNIYSSDIAYSDASFIRLKNVSLTYALPQTVVRDAHIRSMIVYMQCQNLFTITGYKGMDPENRSTIALPPLRMLTFGVRAGL